MRFRACYLVAQQNSFKVKVRKSLLPELNISHVTFKLFGLFFFKYCPDKVAVFDNRKSDLGCVPFKIRLAA